MDPDTFTSSNIEIAKCTDADCNRTTPVSIRAIDTSAVSFTAYPSANFDPSSIYQVSLYDGITSSVGVAIDPITWMFTSSASSAACEIAGVNVSPSEETFEESGQRETFNAQALAADQCIVLDDATMVWGWSIDNPSLASFVSSCVGDSSCEVEGLQEGNTDLWAEETISSYRDDAALVINFTDPYVVDYWPGCSSTTGTVA